MAASGHFNADLKVKKEILKKNGETQIGSIKVKLTSKNRLGEGGGGKVYRGSCSTRDGVAVKQIHYVYGDELPRAIKEIKHLQKVQNGDGIIRFFHVERSNSFYYMAMELASGTVEDYVNGKLTKKLDEKAILRDSSIGLRWLHAHGIVHRDIKPSNILLVEHERDRIRGKLADFGISKDLTTSGWTTGAVVGTSGWMAPETLTQASSNETIAGAADVCSLGLVFCYVLSKGGHPSFKIAANGTDLEIENDACLNQVQDGSAKKLIEEMIKLNPQERPSSKYVASHPTFWDDEKTSRFIQVISDLITAEDEELKAAVNVDPTRVLGEEQGKPKDWRKIIDLSSLEKDLKRQRSYKETTSQLVRLIRNKLHHFDEVPEEGRRMVGDTPSGLVDYIIDKFPLLLVHVWEAAQIRREKTSICLFYTGSDIVKVDPSTIILRDGVGLSELTELRSSRETLERLSVAATDLSQLEKHLPKGLRRINVRGPEVTEPRWPERDEDDGLSVSLQGVAADTISHLPDLGRTVTVLEIYDCPDLTTASMKPLTKFPELYSLILPGGVTEAVSLKPLARCRGLKCLSVIDINLQRLKGQLPKAIQSLNVRGPEVTEPRWPERHEDDGLLVSLQGVAADTISHLADLRRTVYILEIYDSPDLTAGSLESLTRFPKLQCLTLSGGVPDTESLEPLTKCTGLLKLTLSGGVPDTVSLEPLTSCRKLRWLTLSGGVPDTVSLEPLTRCRELERLSVATADLPLLRGQLPESLRCLNVRGLKVTEPRWPERYGSGLSVSLQGVAASTISRLADLGRTVTLLEIYDCPDLTTSSLEPLSRCSELESLTLSGGITDAESLEPPIKRPRLQDPTLSGGVTDAKSLMLHTRVPKLQRLSVAAADLPRLRGQLPDGLRLLNLRGPEMTKPRWPGRYGSGLSVSLQGVAADTISHLATELGSRITLLDTDAQVTTIPSQLRGVIIRVDSNTVILPAGVGDSELTELRSSRETVERLSVSAADLPRLREQLPEGLERLNVRGTEVTEPRWPEWYGNGLSVSLQGVTADTISHLADLGRTVTVLEIYDCPDLTAGSLESLTRCPELRWLTLSGGVPDAVSLEPLTRCPELWGLTLSGGVPDTVSLEPLTRCPELRRLTLSGGVTDAVLDSLSGCPGLVFLTLGDRQAAGRDGLHSSSGHQTGEVVSEDGVAVPSLHGRHRPGRADRPEGGGPGPGQ